MSNFVRIKDGINLGSLTTDPVFANKGDVYFNITTNQLKMFDGTTWGTPILMSEKAVANGVATLDAAGKIPNSQIPAIAITDTFVVADESAMLALSTAETGDVAIRTDVSRCFILAGTNPAILADWKELLTPPDVVTSVNGQIGVVSLDTDDINEGSTNLYFTNQRVLDALPQDIAPTDTPQFQDVEIIGPGLGNRLIGKTVARMSSTGVLSGLDLSVNVDNSKFDVAPGMYEIVDLTNPDAPIVIPVNYPGSVANVVNNLATSDNTYIFMDSAGVIYQQSTPPTPSERRARAFVGRLNHASRTSIEFAQTTPDFKLSHISQVYDLMDAMAPFKIGGLAISPNGNNLSINRASGQAFFRAANYTSDKTNPHQLMFSGGVSVPFRKMTQNAFIDTTDVTNIDPEYYDVGGVRTLSPGNNHSATVQRVYLYRGGNIRIAYGQVVYQNLSTAINSINSESYTPNPSIDQAAILLGYIVVTKNATNLSDPTQAAIITAARFDAGGSAVAGGTTSLQQAYLNSVLPQISLNSTQGALTIDDAVTSVGTLFDVRDNSGTTSYLKVTSSNVTSDVQVGIGTSTPNSSSILDLTSTNKGFLPPRMTELERDAIVSPVAGLLIYNTTTNKTNQYNGVSWAEVGGGSGGLAEGPFNLINGQAIPSPITGLSIDKNFSKAAKLDYTIRRNHIGANYSGGEPDTVFNNLLGEGFYRKGLSEARSFKYSSLGDVLLVAGRFDSFDTSTASNLVFLNSDGTLNPTLNTNLGTGIKNTESIYSIVSSIDVQADGKYVGVGAFNVLNGVPQAGVFRLNSDGTPDNSFNANIGSGFLTYNQPQKVIVSPITQKIIIVGYFSNYNSTTAQSIVCLNPDGTLDTSFMSNINTGGGISGSVVDATFLPDGRIVIVGYINTFNGSSTPGIVCLNPDGTQDATFNVNLLTFDNYPSKVLGLPNGKIVIGGYFNQYGGNPRQNILMLESTGFEDTSWYATASPNIDFYMQFDLAADSLSNIYISAYPTVRKFNSLGNFESTYVLNQGSGTSANVNIGINPTNNYVVTGFHTVYNGITRNLIVIAIDNLGSEVLYFANNEGAGPLIKEATNNIYTIKQPDGKIIVYGGFSFFNINQVGGLIRLNTDGSLDTTFMSNIGSAVNTNFGQGIYSVGLTSLGKIILGGDFYSFNGYSASNLIALNSDGTLDTTFNANIGGGFNGRVNTVSIQIDDKVLVGGFFNTFRGNNRPYFIRLNADGTEDTAFVIATGAGFNSNVNTIVTQVDGKILVGGNFSSFNSLNRNYLIRLNFDGTEDLAFSSTYADGLNSQVNKIKLTSTQQIVVVGNFSQYKGLQRKLLTKLTAQGDEDATFVANYGSGFSGFEARTVELDVYNNIYISGYLYDIVANGTLYYAGAIAKFSVDGEYDPTFITNLGGINTRFGIEHILSTTEGIYITGGKINSITPLGFARVSAAINIPTTKLYKTGQLMLSYNDITNFWEIGAEISMGQNPGVDLSINPAGQINYTTSFLPGTLQDSYIKWILTKI